MDATKLLERLQAQKDFKDQVWNPYFEKCDKYYIGYKQNRVWKSTKKPRANIKLHATSDIIETLQSRAIFALFHSGGENFFDIVSEDVDVARGYEERTNHILHSPTDLSGRNGFFNLKRAIRYIFTYGIGFTGIAYNPNIARAVINCISVYDIFWDAMNSPWLDDSEWVSVKSTIPIRTLENYRETPGYKIPPEKTLAYLETMDRSQATETQGDFYKADKATRAIGQDATGSYSSGRAPGEIDLYRISSPEEIYWLAEIDGNPYKIFEGPNNLGFQPYCSAVFRPLLDAFGGLSVSDLVSGEHDLQQSVTNTALDILDLRTEPPRTTGAGNVKTKTWDPGALIQTDEAQRDKVLQTDFPGEIFGINAESRARMLRTGGTNEMSLGGTPQPSNANRTLGGIQLQSAASSERHFAAFSDIESTLIVPTLLKALMADQNGLPGNQETIPGRSFEGGPTQIPTANLKGKSVTLTLRGATRMVGVERLAGLVPTVFQYVLDPQIQAQAAKAGYMPDFEEFIDFFADATATSKKYRFYKPITQQQEQRLQQDALQGEQVKAQSRMASDQIKAQTQLKLAELREQGLSDERILKLLDLLTQDKTPAAPAKGSA